MKQSFRFDADLYAGIHRQRGFTLIEILIAIFILATVLITVYVAYTGTLKIIKETNYSNGIYSMARVSFGRMICDLESVSAYEGSFKFISHQSELDEKDFMDLDFSSSSHLSFDDENGKGSALITYYIEEDSEKEGYVLLRKDVLHEEDEGAEKRRGFILCDRLNALTFKFYGSEGEEHDSWDSDSEIQKNKAPNAVAINIEFVNPGDRENPYRFMSRVYIPRAVGQ